MNESSKRVAIVDLVGRGNGAMDYYDIELQKGLEQNGVECHIYSNFHAAGNVFKCFVASRKNIFQKTLNYLYGYTSALIQCKKKGIPTVIFHYFQGTLQDLFPYFLANIFGLKKIVIVHDIVSMAGNDIRFAQKLILNRYSDFLVVHNNFSKKQLDTVLSEEAKSKVRVIPHGAYTELIDSSICRTQARQKLQLDNDKPYLLFFGKIKKTKGLDVLLKAMVHVNENIELIIAGKPWKDDFKRYISIIEESGIGEKVKYNLSYVSDRDRDYYFKACDAIVLPYREIFQSGVLLMALSYSLPVIASDLESNKEIIVHGVNGVLFASGDDADLALKINELLADPEKLDMIKNECRNTIAEKYNWNKIAAQYVPFL